MSDYNDDLPEEPITLTNMVTGQVYVIDASKWPEGWLKRPVPSSPHWTEPHKDTP